MSVPPAPQQPQLASLQVFRGFAAVWVLIFHVQCIADLRLGYYVASPFMLAGWEAVDFFFVLSGFIITFVHWKHLGVSANVRPYLARRLSRIYPLVFIVVLLKLAFFVVTGSGTETKELTTSSALSSLFLLPAPLYVIDVLWTLVFEIFFYVVFALAVAFGRRTAIIGAVVWVVIILTRHFTGPLEYNSTFAGIVSHSFCLLFLVGAVAARIFASPRWMPRLGWLWIPGLAVMIMGVWFPGVVASLPLSEATRGLINRLLWGIASALIILSAASVERRKGLRWPPWLQMLGDASYSIYLVHTSVMMVLVLIVKRLHLNLDHWLAVALTALGVLSLVVSILFWRWVERPVTAWWNRRIRPMMSGGRKLQASPGAEDPARS